jgi:hypothetical protein
MTPARQNASHEAAKALHRVLVRAALSWNVDPERATHNPVFIKDSALNYYFCNSTREHVSSFLRENGVLEEGFNGADRLPVPLDQIDSAADAAFARGIATESIIEALIGLLYDEFNSFYWNGQTFPDFQLSPNPRAVSLNFPNEAEELVSVMQNLQILGYVQVMKTGRKLSKFQWTAAAFPILGRLWLLPTPE